MVKIDESRVCGYTTKKKKKKKHAIDYTLFNDFIKFSRMWHAVS